MFKTTAYKTFALAALLLAAACAKTGPRESVLEREPVRFSTYSMRSTGGAKADAGFVAPGADFATGAVAAVYAFYHDGSTWAADSTAGTNIPNFMYNNAITKQSDGSWTYSPVKYWPNEFGAGASSTEIDRLSFWGYYPHNAAGLSLYRNGTTTAYDNVTPGLPSVHFEVNSNILNQVDLMFTEPLTDLYKLQGHSVEGGTNYYGSATNGEVTLVFRHALSLVQFNIVSSGDSLPADAEIIITELTLTNVRTVADCPEPYASFADTEDAISYWTTATNPVNMTVPTAASGAYGSFLLLMPQALGEEGSTGHSEIKLTLTYDIRFPSAEGGDSYITYADNHEEKYLWSDTGTAYGVKRWLPGRRYVYNLEAGLERIEFSEVTEMSWTTEWSED